MRRGTADRYGAIIVATLAALAVAAPGRAQVLEIQPDGGVVRYDGPTQFLGAETRTLTARAQPGAARPFAGLAAPSTATAQAIREAAARHQVSERLVEAVAWRESRFNPGAVSPKGARGVMQLMPGTARALGVDPQDPAANIEGGVDYLSRLLRRFDGDKAKALAAYNAGPEAVARFGGVPPYAETVAYVGSILRRLGDDGRPAADAPRP